MNPDDVITLLSKLGELLEPQAKQVWDLAYRQTLITAWSLIAVGTLCLVIAVPLFILGIKTKQDKKNYYNLNGDGHLMIGGFLAGVMLTMYLCGVTMLANPAWHTIELLFNTIK
jgi:hypothetical protein